MAATTTPSAALLDVRGLGIFFRTEAGEVQATRDVSFAVRPVSSRPQVAAFTNSEGLRPRWACQSPAPILSRIRASRVSSSGMRSSASARHISATPSWLDSAYSWIRASTPPPLPVFSCSRSTSQRARAVARSVISPGKVACSIRGGRHSGSGRR